MVRIKYRYLAILIQPDKKLIISPDSYNDIVYDAVYRHYGMKSAIHLNNMQIIDVLSSSNLAVIKVQRKIYQHVKDSLEKSKKLNKICVKINVLCISGSVKGVRKKLLCKLRENDDEVNK